ncbi:MAG: hypothetical protein PHY29_02975 [Syntrophales bacterium]|nr:hypothetical protein [Syntrophales bacterium]
MKWPTIDWYLWSSKPRKEDTGRRRYCSWEGCGKIVSKKGEYCAFHKRKVREKETR